MNGGSQMAKETDTEGDDASESTDMESMMEDMDNIMSACKSMKSKMEKMMLGDKEPSKMSREELAKMK
jgi:hypothetical protein